MTSPAKRLTERLTALLEARRPPDLVALDQLLRECLEGLADGRGESVVVDDLPLNPHQETES